ncbi:MAG: uroporphyrinogen decarboxylase family protein [Syntrophaceae bacterium]
MSSKWAQTIISGAKPRAAMPIMLSPASELTGIGMIDMATNGEKQFACIEALAKQYPSLAVHTGMDLSVEAEAFGCGVRFTDDEVPSVDKRVIAGMEDIEGLAVPVVGTGRTSAYLRAARLAGEAISDRPVFGGCIGPISLAGRLMDTSALMLALMKHVAQAHALLEKCTDFLIEYAGAFKAPGVDGIIVAEPMAGLLSPEKCETFSSRYVARMVDALQDECFTVILHNCGRTQKLVGSMVNTGAHGLHFGNAVNMREIAPLIPADRLFFGNVDPVGVLRNGTPDDVERTAIQLLEDMQPYDNFILSSGCDLPPGTPLANIDAFFRAFDCFQKNA